MPLQTQSLLHSNSVVLAVLRSIWRCEVGIGLFSCSIKHCQNSRAVTAIITEFELCNYGRMIIDSTVFC